MAWTSESRDKAATTRRQNAEVRAAEKAPTSTGIGESRVFCDPDAPQQDDRLLNCHINGKLIRDLGFTPLQLSAISWHITDEGIEANNEGKSEVRASVTRDPLSKSMEKRKDDVLDRGMETWEAENAMQQILDANPRPGFRRRFLADAVVNKRGLRGWQPVIKDGQPVTLGGLKMAEMPIEKAEARNRAVRAAGNERLKQVQERYMEGAEGSAVADQ
jgi:hypothetical protein